MVKSLILVGYMGCGKSTLGSLISEVNSLPFIDLDKYIELKENTSIVKMFDDNGELFFRKKERFYLEQIFMKPHPLIISLGGGTPCYFDNIDFLNLNDQVLTIFLKTSPKELAKRLYKKKDNRPMISHLKSEQELHDYIAKHLYERLPYYLKAKKTIITDKKTIKSLVDEINLLLA
tara:strand:- start:477 stop:1004 length:528 start_codon:yes stop_codon:yes gene_type:complete